MNIDFRLANSLYNTYSTNSQNDTYNNKVQANYKANEIEPLECETCSTRKYQDDSDDSGVSFQTPTHISPESSASEVMSHEMEHYSRDRDKAEQEGKEVVSQSIRLHTSICPECSRIYVSGGVTETKVLEKQEDDLFKEQYKNVMLKNFGVFFDTKV
ncbi:UNVERIFIED_CONTAM: hypothetical protein Cloal_0108 [Acetivibrio alkalicellulosi]